MHNAKKTTACLRCGVIKELHGKTCYPALWPKKPRFYEFHSEGESQRYVNLLLLVRFGAISHLKMQKRFDLSAGYYLADFVYLDRRLKSFWHPSGRRVIEDYKGGYQTETFKEKWAEMQRLYPQYVYRISDKASGLRNE